MHEYILQLKNITKEFPGVKALNNVNLDVKKGEVHALVGENGAGKSTLIKIICGVYPYGTYKGQLLINGEEKRFSNIKEVEKEGIACIHQELNIVPDLSVAENIFLNDKPNKFGIVDYHELYRLAQELIFKVGLDDEICNHIKPTEKLKNLSIGQQQLVEIAKAISKDIKLLILDEPTSALTESESQNLLNVINNLRSKGVTCIYISHKLDEVMKIADRITILRDGNTIITTEKDNIDKETMIKHMVGRELKNMFPSRPSIKRGDVALEVKNYSVEHPVLRGRKLIDNVNLKAYKGEVLGISGLMGSGRTELFSSIFGVYDLNKEGDVLIEGKKVEIKSPIDAIRNGYFLLPENRKLQGLNLLMSVRENTTLATIDKLAKLSVINSDKEIDATKKYINELSIKTPNFNSVVNTLSGGNQQKVVVAKALMIEPKVLILDEPTRGIDVGAKYEIYKLINSLVEQGMAIIMISSEMEEILGMSDRILTMNGGRITGEFNISEATQEKLMLASTTRSECQ